MKRLSVVLSCLAIFSLVLAGCQIAGEDIVGQATKVQGPPIQGTEFAGTNCFDKAPEGQIDNGNYPYVGGLIVKRTRQRRKDVEVVPKDSRDACVKVGAQTMLREVFCSRNGEIKFYDYSQETLGQGRCTTVDIPVELFDQRKKRDQTYTETFSVAYWDASDRCEVISGGVQDESYYKHLDGCYPAGVDLNTPQELAAARSAVGGSGM